ncbi:Kinetochore protein Spc24 [Malassezia caprae]|uniref:Kinetochore protein Spc24 n=1 Tax=Malassezia caprae TaxID=1381934 RepID=A0AAF0EA26_9BASI|nr:Kinetochore protein Spc24 [Malassezia caprae]
MDLFADAADAPDEKFSINQSYAERYQHNKRRVELERLKEKYGNGAEEDEDDSEDDSEDVTEDEDGEQLTPHMDAAILRTLQRIREKKDDLYDTTRRVFDDEQAALATRAFPTKEHKSSSKKMTLRDYQRSRMLEAMKDTSDPAKAFADATSLEPQSETRAQPTHNEEQEAIRSEFLDAARDSGDGDGDDLFHVRAVDGQDENQSYRQALLDAVDEQNGEKNVRDLLRDHTHDEARTQENEDFLMNYILNRGWVDKDLPQSGGQGDKARDWDAEAADLDSEASFDSAADAFEHAYNFRFEDPSLAQKAFAIESFPRHTEDTIRRKDDRRKKARAERAERKKAEKETKMRELDQLKALKRQEIAEKLKRLRDVSGGDNNMDGRAFEGIDFEADFDPEEHDRMMQQQFNDDYYAHEDDTVKPKWDDDIEIDDILAEAEPATKSKKSSKKSKRSDELNIDADYTEGQDMKLSKKERKALKKKEKKAKSKSTAEAAVNEDEMDADKTEMAMSEPDRKHRARELLDQYYNLGYEDMIGDTPTRFKYASVPKENYGLSAVEILLADDADLNNVVGLRNLQPYRRNTAKPSNLKKRLKRFREELDARKNGRN